MKWIVVIVAVLVLGAALSLRTSRQRREGGASERPHRLDDSTSRRRPPTAGDEP